MKLIVKYFFMTLIILQAAFVSLWYFDINFMGLLSWTGSGSNVEIIKLFSPLVVYGLIKILYWVADPISELLNIVLRWILTFIIIYLLYWIFFV